jgi:hypothetical protein
LVHGNNNEKLLNIYYSINIVNYMTVCSSTILQFNVASDTRVHVGMTSKYAYP